MIAQLGERQTEDLKVPGSIPGRGNVDPFFSVTCDCKLVSARVKTDSDGEIIQGYS